jgi:hypothetical protein
MNMGDENGARRLARRTVRGVREGAQLRREIRSRIQDGKAVTRHETQGSDAACARRIGDCRHAVRADASHMRISAILHGAENDSEGGRGIHAISEES